MGGNVLWLFVRFYATKQNMSNSHFARELDLKNGRCYTNESDIVGFFL